MSRDEVKKLLFVVSSTYPNFKTDNLTALIDAWHMILCDFDYLQIQKAYKAFCITSNSAFAPSVAQLIALIPKSENELSAMAAWGIVSKACRNGLYGAEEEFAKMPEIVQKVVGSPSQLRQWAMSDTRSKETVIQSNFMRTYENEVKLAEVRKVDKEIKNSIGGSCEKMLPS